MCSLKLDQGSDQVEVSQSDPHGEVSLKCNQHLIANTEPFKTQPDPRSMDADRLITSEPTMDQGSVLVVGNKLEVMYFTTRICPTNLII